MIELFRLLCSKNRLVILLMIGVVNLALFSGYCRSEREEQVDLFNQRIAWGVSTVQQERAAEQKYLSEDYYTYLSYIIGQDSSQSVLGKLTKKDTFITRNTEKTVRDYKRLEGIKLRSGENRGVLATVNYDVTDYLMLVAPLLLVLELLAEADTAVGALTRTTKRGRVPLTAWRVLAVGLLSAMSVLVMYGGNIVYAAAFYGSAGLLRPLQSIPLFQLCALRIRIGGYFLLTGMLKTLAVTAIALFIWVILSRFHPILGWMISALILGGLYTLEAVILPTSKVSFLKFLNVFAALRADCFFTQYSNMNVLGYPVSFITLMLAVICGAIVLLVLLCLLLVGFCRPKRIGQSFAALQTAIRKAFTRHLPCHTLFGFEGWKLLIAQKGLLIIAVAGIMGFSVWNEMQLYSTVTSEAQRIYDNYSGEVNEAQIKRIAFITNGDVVSIERGQAYLNRRIDEKAQEKADAFGELTGADEHAVKAARNYIKMHLRYSSDQELGKLRSNIERTYSSLKYYEALLGELLEMKQFKADTGLDVWFIRQDCYMLIFRDHAAERRCCMVLLLFLIFAFSGTEAFDNRNEIRMLLRSTKNGRAKMLTAKLVWAALLTAVATVGLHGVFLLHVITDIGLPMSEAPAQSLPLLRWIPVPMTLRTAIALYFVLRFLAAFALAVGVMALSRLSKTPQKGLLLALVVFMLPSALAESGITALRALDFIRALALSKG